MWFNNILIYQFQLENTKNLNELLAEEALKPCPPHARFIYGWLPVFGDDYIHEITGTMMICMGKEERILPRSVIMRMMEEKIQDIETREARSVKRAERQQIAEDLEFELLPKSFCIQKKLHAILDLKRQFLIINTSSENQASQLTGLLKKSLPGLQFQPVGIMENLAIRFTDWILKPDTLPANFELAPDCLLFSRSDEKKKVNCKGYELPAEEITTLLSQGLDVAEISLIWNEHIQFTLTHDFILKKLKTQDYLVEEFNEIKDLEEQIQQQDAALTLLSGELRSLLDSLLSSLEVTKAENEVSA